MSPDTSVCTLPPLPRAVRALTDEQSRHLERTYPDLPRSLADCITCRGTGTFRWYDAGRRPATYTCPCADQYVLHRVLLYAGVPEAFQRYGWGDFLDPLPEPVMSTVAEYRASAPAFIGQGFGLILHGPRGSGKSLLATLLLKGLVGEGFDCYATTFTAMLDTFAKGWKDRDDAQWFSRQVRNAGVLVIDDLGRERNKGKENNLGESTLEEVIRHRVARSKPTILTTNLDIEQIAGGYGGHTMSLLRERSATCAFTGPDRRADISARFLDEITAGLTRPIVLS